MDQSYDVVVSRLLPPQTFVSRILIVQLLMFNYFQSVRVRGRTDCCTNRFNYLEVRVGDEDIAGLSLGEKFCGNKVCDNSFPHFVLHKRTSAIKASHQSWFVSFDNVECLLHTLFTL